MISHRENARKLIRPVTSRTTCAAARVASRRLAAWGVMASCRANAYGVSTGTASTASSASVSRPPARAASAARARKATAQGASGRCRSRAAHPARVAQRRPGAAQSGSGINPQRREPRRVRRSAATASTTSGLCMMVKDDGPGTAAADEARLTDRFYCGEHRRTTPGNDLALPSSKRLPNCTVLRSASGRGSQ
jgi:hypothetical protein